MTKFNNVYFIMRHGGSKCNAEEFMCSWPEKQSSPLTREGRAQIEMVIPRAKKAGVDLIFSSDLLRTKQTAQIIARVLKLGVRLDKRLREYNFGIYNGRPAEEWVRFLNGQKDMFKKRPPRGETRREIRKRMLDFIKDIDKKYKNKRILIISHREPLLELQGGLMGLSDKEIYNNGVKLRLNTGEFRELC
jgi:isoleucyl-tRNA synthetase